MVDGGQDLLHDGATHFLREADILAEVIEELSLDAKFKHLEREAEKSFQNGGPGRVKISPYQENVSLTFKVLDEVDDVGVGADQPEKSITFRDPRLPK